MLSPLKIYVDYWCPMCLGFASFLQRIDIFNCIIQKDIRSYEGDLISKDKGLKLLASVNKDVEVFYGYDSIFQILLRLPVFWLLIPVFWIFKISRLGHLVYKELAIKRQIIPLHCKEEDCLTK
ncbi:MAG: DCC1-like thiol-disulfide oxidoreductase family protein [Flavobacteriales bacterium]